MRPERRYRMAGTVLAGLLMAFSVETEVRAEEASTIEMLQQPEMPIGNVGGEAHADPFTGAATMSIPIEVPPGRNGIQPSSLRP